MRETVKKFTHEIDGEELIFQVHKMDALHGSFLLKFVAEKLLPLIDSFQTIFVDIDGEDEEEVAKKRTDAIMRVIPKALQSISKEELFDFERQCLNSVDIMMPAGWIEVMDGDHFSVEEVKYDPFLALILCFDVVTFNFSGFFGGKGLSSLLKPQLTSK